MAALEAIEPAVDDETTRRIERAVTEGRQEAEVLMAPPSAEAVISTDDLF